MYDTVNGVENGIYVTNAIENDMCWRETQWTNRNSKPMLCYRYTTGTVNTAGFQQHNRETVIHVCQLQSFFFRSMFVFVFVFGLAEAQQRLSHGVVSFWCMHSCISRIVRIVSMFEANVIRKLSCTWVGTKIKKKNNGAVTKYMHTHSQIAMKIGVCIRYFVWCAIIGVKIIFTLWYSTKQPRWFPSVLSLFTVYSLHRVILHRFALDCLFFSLGKYPLKRLWFVISSNVR